MLRSNLIRASVLVCFAGVLVPLVGAADPATEARYPYDPACPWGRVANGKGMITRCITETEARALAIGRAPAAPAAPAKAPATTPATPAQPTSAAAPAVQAPTTATPTPVEPPVTPPEGAPATGVPVKIEVGPILPEEGELALGALHKPLDKYRACVEENGGLSGKTGEVQLHFLVRGERSRAEGVEVTKVRGVSQKAARCMADVVDRRRTGTPTAPMVGATLVIKISS